MTTTTMTTEKHEALRRSGQLPAPELPEVIRCESFGHVVSLDWMSSYRDSAHAKRVKARLLALVGTTCLRCIDWRRGESANWIEADSVRSEIMGRVEKQQQAARVTDERAREQARIAPPPPVRRAGSQLERALANTKEESFEGV